MALVSEVPSLAISPGPRESWSQEDMVALVSRCQAFLDDLDSRSLEHHGLSCLWTTWNLGKIGSHGASVVKTPWFLKTKGPQEDPVNLVPLEPRYQSDALSGCQVTKASRFRGPLIPRCVVGRRRA